jgi:hypothetical protein
MKNECFFSIRGRLTRITLFSLMVLPAMGQTTWIANSAPGAVAGTNVFTGANAINNAIAAASNGDIIYVVPSGVVYSTPSFNGKQVSLFGGGFNPSNPSGGVSALGGVYLNANNVRLSGLVVLSGGVNMAGSFSNIIIDNCKIRYVTDGSGGSAKANLVIRNCIIGEEVANGSASLLIGSGSTGVSISNNIILCTGSGTACIDELSNAVVQNNIFIGAVSGSSVAAFREAVNSDIRSNIFYAVRPSGTNLFTGNIFQYNLSYDASDNTFPTVNNTSISNIEDQNPMFVNFGPGTTYPISMDAHLQEGSPAEGTGYEDTDMGIFGGLTPFNVHGAPLPVVHSVTHQTIIDEDSDLTIRIQAEGN